MTPDLPVYKVQEQDESTIEFYIRTCLFPLFVEQENDRREIVLEDMTDKESDSISNTESGILEVEGGYWSAGDKPYMWPMTRSKTKIKTLAKANALMEEMFSTEKYVNVAISTSQSESSVSLIKVEVDNTVKLFTVSLF